jgi:hypothetical protein
LGKANASAAVTTHATAVHLSLQGKGGVGKSLVASIVAQYLRYRGVTVQCIDTDPVNHTFAQYKVLEARHLRLLRNGGIDPRGFDQLLESVFTEGGTFVVDNGASTFIPLWNYFLENDVLRLLGESGCRIVVHTIITGGQALGDTLQGFHQLAQSTQARNLVVWVNEYFGRVERDGKAFPDMNVYKENESKVLGTVAIPKRNQDTFGRDLEEMIARKLTFDEAIDDPATSIMSRQRLKVVQRELYDQLDALRLAE